MSDLTSKDFKPGDLAWGTVEPGPFAQQPQELETVLLERVADDTWQWKTVGNLRGISINHHRERVTNLRPATVCGPDEHPVANGTVTLRLGSGYLGGWDALVSMLEMADEKLGGGLAIPEVIRQIKEQVAPPVPPEPEHDALVSDEQGYIWSHVVDDEWECINSRMGVATPWTEVARGATGPLTIYRPIAAPTPSEDAR